MASAIVRAYNGGLGAEPPAKSRGRAPRQESGERSPPEAEAFLAFGRLMEATNLPTFRNFGNTKTLDIYVIFAKNYGWPRDPFNMILLVTDVEVVIENCRPILEVRKILPDSRNSGRKISNNG